MDSDDESPDFYLEKVKAEAAEDDDEDEDEESGRISSPFYVFTLKTFKNGTLCLLVWRST